MLFETTQSCNLIPDHRDYKHTLISQPCCIYNLCTHTKFSFDCFQLVSGATVRHFFSHFLSKLSLTQLPTY